ncbi:hypothetical protein DPMN_027492 [Dreissena polymorpha]|uniref:Uncharacterized protein n=1 Tax=Dreissena polymorpha TaxID=45954 RepID=A0A9D4LVB4_DREPO|nr:hypothetical protein DPMN_027492 [Dreissena polymorpha]
MKRGSLPSKLGLWKGNAKISRIMSPKIFYLLSSMYVPGWSDAERPQIHSSINDIGKKKFLREMLRKVHLHGIQRKLLPTTQLHERSADPAIRSGRVGRLLEVDRVEIYTKTLRGGE